MSPTTSYQSYGTAPVVIYVQQTSPPVSAQTVNLTNGAIYHGEVRDGIPHGRGRITYKSGNVFEGMVQNGKANGHGVYTYKSGEVYTGDMVDDKFHGQGRYVAVNGDILEGQFENDKLHGRGKYIQTSGFIQEGIFKNNKLWEGEMRNTSTVNRTYGDNYSVGHVVKYHEGKAESPISCCCSLV